MPNWAFLLMRLAIGVSASALMTWIGWKLGGAPWMLTALVFSTPLIGVAIARPLVELVHEGFGWLAAQPLKVWQGSYYAFNNVQVRVYEADGEMWFVAADVMKACDIERIPDRLLSSRAEGCRTIPGTRLTGLNLARLESLLVRRPEREPIRFLHWARREVLVPWERKNSRSR